MKGTIKRAVVLLAAVSTLCGLAGAAWSSQTTEGQVVAVQEWNLFVRTTSGEPMSFSPYWVSQDGKSWGPSVPAKTVLPALESGEMVKVSWTLDEREGRRRIDGIQVLSAASGTIRGTVVTSGPSQLVISPKDEPGTVTLNPQWKQVEGRWIQDPAVTKILSTLRKGMKVAVQWSWDQEGRKRIVGFVTDSQPAAAATPLQSSTTKRVLVNVEESK